ncbi:MAG: hypothetical protein PQJ58_10185 [Spirochaetales bacterium]|nr:hypothetical protein [Spirochaetales bacterium]
MIRMDIFAHEALELPLREALAAVPEGSLKGEGKEGQPFTLFRQVAGRGSSGSSFADDVWPESNISMVFFIEDDQEDRFRDAIRDIRQAYPLLGLAVFAAEGYRTL